MSDQTPDTTASTASEQRPERASEFSLDIEERSIGDAVTGWITKLRTGDPGALPSVLGLVILAIIFMQVSDRFLSQFNIGNIPGQGAYIAVIGLGLVFVLLLVVPILEIATIIAVGRVIGGWQALVLLLVESALGAWLVRREGARAWKALTTALNTGQMPSRQLADAALVLVGGTLLLAPGFLTDLVGFFFILPFTRPIARCASGTSLFTSVDLPTPEWPTTTVSWPSSASAISSTRRRTCDKPYRWP